MYLAIRQNFPVRCSRVSGTLIVIDKNIMSNKRSDIFRFMAIREPDKLGDVDAARINASGDGQGTSVLLQTLEDSLQSDTPADTIENIAKDYVNNKLRGATVYTTSLRSLDARLSDLGAKIHRKPTKNQVSIVKSEIARLGITDVNLANWKNKLDDSFNAALILRKGRGADLRGIERAIRTLHVISQVKSGAISDSKSIAGALTKTISVSKSIVSKAPSEDFKKDDEKIKRDRDNAERVKKAVEEYEGNYEAIKELTAAYDKDWEMRRIQQSEEDVPAAEAREIPAVYNGAIQKLGRWLGITPVSKKVSIPASKPHQNGTGFQSILAEDITKNISGDTKDRLLAIGSNTDKIEASYAITRLEEKNQDIANNLYSVPTGTTMAMIGSGAIMDTAGTMEVYVDPGDIAIFRPGGCSVSTADAPIKKDDFTFKHCKFNSLGVGELQVVKQKLIDYEIGEIAHIENVMASEKRSRSHRTLHRTEEFTSFELEREEETERDLETTTRFELQKEIDKEVQKSTKKEAGLTVTGSYGPSVEFSANAGIATDSSSSKSESLSTSYSNEVVDRSVHRIQEKIKEKRTFLTIDEVEVINKHGFKNQEAGAEQINGIYRWVNKKYEAQVFNYGKRELIEVIIPEPAAFLRYLATNSPKEGSTISKPLKPGYCIDGVRFVPLSPGTLTEINYVDWVSAYNIQDIVPPPPSSIIESAVFTSEEEGSSASKISELAYKISFANKEMDIPATYQAVEAWFSLGLIKQGFEQIETIPSGALFGGTTTETKGLTTYGDVIIGKETLPVNSNSTFNPHHLILNREEGKLAIAVSIFSVLQINATVEVRFQRTQRSLQEWRISTFNSIMNRYEILKEEYEEAISGDEVFGSVDIQGKNPIENQKIILNELKRQVITQMTGQSYDGFDAMQDNVGEYGYPQQDVDEAWSEGQEIRFVEQAFEWENLQYLFYPYYWGKKKDWPITSQLEDTDPLFKDFLQAGSCRLNVAVRPGFEASVNTFLSTSKFPWDSKDDTTVIECLDIDNEEEEAVDPFLTITEEVKARQGAVSFKSGGTITHLAADLDTVLTGDMVEDIDENGDVILDNGAPVLVNGTDFTKDDVNREINIAAKIYMIISVDVGQQKITLDEDVADPSLKNAQFGIGAKAIGVPCMVTIPNSLVILQEGNALEEIEE